MHLTPVDVGGDARTIAVILETGDEIVGTLERLARSEGWRASHFTAIGALSEATLAYFDWETRDYVDIPITEQMEVLSLVGDVSVKDGVPRLHAHAVLGSRDGTTRGGHLKAGRVRPTLEVMLVETGGHLERRYDPESRLDLIRPVHVRGGRGG
ncbi:MAG: PPC domain-containing DNA-binding protein [Vicinamibacterales bacterium]